MPLGDLVCTGQWIELGQIWSAKLWGIQIFRFEGMDIGYDDIRRITFDQYGNIFRKILWSWPFKYEHNPERKEVQGSVTDFSGKTPYHFCFYSFLSEPKFPYIKYFLIFKIKAIIPIKLFMEKTIH